MTSTHFFWAFVPFSTLTEWLSLIFLIGQCMWHAVLLLLSLRSALSTSHATMTKSALHHSGFTKEFFQILTVPWSTSWNGHQDADGEAESLWPFCIYINVHEAEKVQLRACIDISLETVPIGQTAAFSSGYVPLRSLAAVCCHGIFLRSKATLSFWVGFS